MRRAAIYCVGFAYDALREAWHDVLRRFPDVAIRHGYAGILTPQQYRRGRRQIAEDRIRR